MAVQISGNDITVPRDGSFTRNVTIGGTLTYEDVTNIDSVGLVTARNGIEIGARPGVAASISVDGNMIVSGISTFNGDVKLDGGNLVLGDSGGATDDRLTFGAGTDLSIYHNGTDSIIDNATNNLKFIAANDVEAIKIFSDGTVNIGATADNIKLRFGIGSDLQLYHNGSNSFITNGTGQLEIRSDTLILQDNANGHSMLKGVADGAVEIYYDNSKKFETTSTGITISGSDTTGSVVQGDFRLKKADATQHIVYDASNARMNFADSVSATFGDANDFLLKHTGSTNQIQSESHRLIISGSASDNVDIMHTQSEYLASFIPNGAVELYHNNEKKLYTYTDGVFVQDDSSAGAYLVIATNAGTQGSLYGTANTLGLLDGQNHYMLKGVKDGAVELYYDNTKTFETRSDGVTLTGQMVQTSTSARAIACNRQGSAGEMILFDFQGTKCGAINVNTNSTEYATTGSDITLKKNFELWDENVLNLFKNINPQKFHFNNQEDTEKKHKGFIAQEMVNSFPEAYTKDDKDKYWFNPSGMVVYLMKSIQELSVENAALKARLDAAGL